jgi:hypothetical protein
LPVELQSRPFTTAEARRAGVGRGVLCGPAVRSIFPGVYVAAAVEPSEPVRVLAALKVLPPNTLVTGITALRMLGVAVGHQEPLTFVTRHPHQIRLTGVRVIRVGVLPRSHRGVVPADNAFTVAATRLDLAELVVAGDWLVRLGRSSPAALVQAADASAGRGVRLARRAARLVRDRVDSPRESSLRLCLVLAGLPEPECNLTLGSAREPIGRVDLVYLEFKVIIEYEGDQHRTDVHQWNVDIRRQEAFGDEGWCVIRVTASRMRRPRAVVDRVYQALRAAGYRGPAPSFSSEWIGLFESTAR